MAQGYTGYNIINVGTGFYLADGPNIDAFSRLRISNPLTIFNNQFTYDLSPLVFQQYTNGASITHDAVERCAKLMILVGGTDGFMQSYEYIPYQPGRSQLVFITFNMCPAGLNPGVIKYAGLGDTDNGFFFAYDGTDFAFKILSNTTVGDQTAIQSAWNLDKLNGTGTSGVTIDFTKSQILVIDFQALYTGRVRFGFDIGGQIIYAHEFLHANTAVYPYIQTANLPIKVGIQNNGTLVNDHINFVCCSVASEGGSEDSQKFAYEFCYGDVKTITSANNTNYLMSLQPRTTFNGFTNRTKFVLEDIQFFNESKDPVKWYLIIGYPVDTYGPTWTNVNTNYSTMNYDITAVTPAATPFPANSIIIQEGFVPGSTGSFRGSVATNSVASRYPITLDSSGATRDFGTLSLWAETLAVGVSTVKLFFTIKWKEIR